MPASGPRLGLWIKSPQAKTPCCGECWLLRQSHLRRRKKKPSPRTPARSSRSRGLKRRVRGADSGYSCVVLQVRNRPSTRDVSLRIPFGGGRGWLANRARGSQPGPRCTSLAIDILSVSYPKDDDLAAGVVNWIDDTVAALTDSIPILMPSQFLGSMRARVGGQTGNLLYDSSTVTPRSNSLDLLGCRGLKKDPIYGHGASGRRRSFQRRHSSRHAVRQMLRDPRHLRPKQCALRH